MAFQVQIFCLQTVHLKKVRTSYDTSSLIRSKNADNDDGLKITHCFVDLVAGVDSTSTYIIREPVLKGPAICTVSSLDPVIQFNGASVINNQHEEEDKDNGVSSSDALSSDNSSQEGKN